ncbi:GntR family transcriptional regulator [Saccharopolyspora sp. K220]|uniref:GntR family transcriptional regulator n=1 Tax=Saccharopolyspora soli TaxID=2926618 RepID=UPI001F5648D3|nr:GntR family transcriptional regulator [Saccharopolyspora soli]MCI2424150.1 GntR family transcriptional regulator [Saccharopolyspora soli]
MAEPAGYLRVADDLRERIISGGLAPGDRLPSRTEISRTYRVGQNVAISAVQILMAEGLVEGRAGSGVFVRHTTGHLRVQRSSMSGHVHGAPFVATRSGDRIPGERESTSSTMPAPAHIAARLGIEVGEGVMRSEYAFMAGGERTMMSTSWEPLAITGGTPVALPNTGPKAGEGVVERMAYIGILVDRTVEAVSARPASADEAHRLNVPKGSIVQVLQRTYYTADRPVETADIVVAASRYQIEYEIPVSPRQKPR